MATAAQPEMSSLYTYDPVFSRKKAAVYLGRSVKTLDRLKLERTPMPGTAAIPEMGYRLSTLNAHLESLKNPKARPQRKRS